MTKVTQWKEVLLPLVLEPSLIDKEEVVVSEKTGWCPSPFTTMYLSYFRSSDGPAKRYFNQDGDGAPPKKVITCIDPSTR